MFAFDCESLPAVLESELCPCKPAAKIAPPFMGDYEDGFHNKLTIHAVANPVNEPEPGQFPEPVDLHRKATGYNIVRFNKVERSITLETWPRYADPTDPKTGSQYPGWPITVKTDGQRWPKSGCVSADAQSVRDEGSGDPNN